MILNTLRANVQWLIRNHNLAVEHQLWGLKMVKTEAKRYVCIVGEKPIFFIGGNLCSSMLRQEKRILFKGCGF